MPPPPSGLQQQRSSPICCTRILQVTSFSCVGFRSRRVRVRPSSVRTKVLGIRAGSTAAATACTCPTGTYVRTDTPISGCIQPQEQHCCSISRVWLTKSTSGPQESSPATRVCPGNFRTQVVRDAIAVLLWMGVYIRLERKNPIRYNLWCSKIIDRVVGNGTII
jgi:hypothetical protein